MAPHMRRWGVSDFFVAIILGVGCLEFPVGNMKAVPSHAPLGAKAQREIKLGKSRHILRKRGMVRRSPRPRQFFFNDPCRRVIRCRSGSYDLSRLQCDDAALRTGARGDAAVPARA